MELIERIILKIIGGDAIENQLLRCQSYRSGSIPKWKAQTNLNWIETIKFLKALEIFDAARIRQVITNIVQQNESVFNGKNVFITAFGSEGKSGGKIVYEFRHSKLISHKSFVNGWELTKLPEESVIIFVEDLIGTGLQSTEYILEKLNLLLNPSHTPYLLTICATPEGINKVKNETNFQVITGVVLSEAQYQHYSPENSYFSEKVKKKLISLNNKLENPKKASYDRGLLVAFYYSPPNNSMPILWKDNYPYDSKDDLKKKWFALIPREY